MDSSTEKPTLTPGRIAGLYLLFGLAALAFSDVLLPRVLSGDALHLAQGVKGAVEIAATAAVVYLLVHRGQRSLRAANSRLERNDQMLQVLLRLLRHDIRNDMNVIQGHAESAYREADDGHVEDSCHAILTTADELLQQTETVNQLRDMLEGTASPETFDLAALVEDLVAEARRTTGGDLRTSTDAVGDAEVAANSLLPLALGEVVDNAVRYNDSATPTVTFSTERVGDRVELRVADDGPGIPEAEQKVLSELEESPLVHSSGLGLWFVYWVVSDAGGDVSIDDRDGEGTVVTLSLPAADGDAVADGLLLPEFP